MSQKHPVVVITGSSGAGTSTVKKSLISIFQRQKINPAVIEGDSYHRYNRTDMHRLQAEASDKGKNLSQFGADANEFARLEQLFKDYGDTSQGEQRYYLHNEEEAAHHSQRFDTRFEPGQFTPWESLPPDTDLLFYEGLHGLVKTDTVDLPRYVDFKVGVVPVVNLEWIQKIHRDSAERGYSEEAIVDSILRRMPDYVKYITPQFSETDINFQRVATVDTSNPFVAREIPTLDESFVIIRFKHHEMRHIDLPNLLNMIQGSFMSRENTIVVPGGKMRLAMEIIFPPIIADLMDRRQTS